MIQYEASDNLFKFASVVNTKSRSSSTEESLAKNKSPVNESFSSCGMLISSNDLGSGGRSQRLIRFMVFLSAFLEGRHGTISWGADGT